MATKEQLMEKIDDLETQLAECKGDTEQVMVKLEWPHPVDHRHGSTVSAYGHNLVKDGDRYFAAVPEELVEMLISRPGEHFVIPDEQEE